MFNYTLKRKYIQNLSFCFKLILLWIYKIKNLAFFSRAKFISKKREASIFIPIRPDFPRFPQTAEIVLSLLRNLIPGSRKWSRGMNVLPVRNFARRKNGSQLGQTTEVWPALTGPIHFDQPPGRSPWKFYSLRALDCAHHISKSSISRETILARLWMIIGTGFAWPLVDQKSGNDSLRSVLMIKRILNFIQRRLRVEIPPPFFSLFLFHVFFFRSSSSSSSSIRIFFSNFFRFRIVVIISMNFPISSFKYRALFIFSLSPLTVNKKKRGNNGSSVSSLLKKPDTPLYNFVAR